MGENGSTNKNEKRLFKISSSYQRCSVKKAFLKKSLESLFNKVAGQKAICELLLL